jgi:spore maturation protein CgeB
MADLRRKIEYFLSNPGLRDKIAQSGHARTAREHTYEHRFGRILAVAEELRGRHTQEGVPSTYELDSEWFASVVKRHETGFTLRLLRQLLVTLLALFFGRARGARAARRLVYEISWRLSQGKTYTAAGLPGRMFYRES